jgi:hypothetical protein
VSFHVAARPGGEGAVHPVGEVLPSARLAVSGAQAALACHADAVIVAVLLAGGRVEVAKTANLRPFDSTASARGGSPGVGGAGGPAASRRSSSTRSADGGGVALAGG